MDDKLIMPLAVLRSYIRANKELSRRQSQISLGFQNSYAVPNPAEVCACVEGRLMSVDAAHPLFRNGVNEHVLHYAYGLVVNRTEARGRVYVNATPIFMQRVRCRQAQGRIDVELEAEGFELNQGAISSLPATKGFGDEELGRLLADWSRVAEEAGEEKLESAFSFFGLPGDPGKVEFSGGDLGELPDGLHPVEVLFEAASPFTRRLLKELSFLEQTWSRCVQTGNVPQDLAWKFLSRSPVCVPDADKWNPPGICPFPSNYEQTQIAGVVVGTDADLMLVSGPPGTGKSQLILNIIANQAYDGKTVLFASKNNQAVDVVVGKLNHDFLGYPLVKRTGSNAQVDNFRELERQAAVGNAEPAADMCAATPEDEVQASSIRRTLRRLEDDQRAYTFHKGRVGELLQLLEKLESRPERVVRERNWIEPRECTFPFAKWEGVRKYHQAAVTKSESFWGRLDAHRYTRSYLKLWFSKDAYRNVVRSLALDELGKAFAVEELELFSETELLEPSLELLDLLRELEDTNRMLTEAREFLAGYDPEAFFDRWREAETERVGCSRRLLFSRMRAVDRPNDEGGRYVCQASTTLSLANEIQMTAGAFDLAIVDEASQNDIASCLPVLYRAKRVLVVGDAMQLGHVDGLSREKHAEYRKEEGIEGKEWDSLDLGASSFLDACEFWSEFRGAFRGELLEHYRCHPDIIGYCNRQFYQERLRIMTDPHEEGGVRLHVCNGECQPRWVNEVEAVAVVSRVCVLLRGGVRPEDIGVVTPFRAQADRIRELMRADPALSDETRHAITVSTSHGFQGDERQRMLLSLVAAPGIQDGTLSWMSEPVSPASHLLNVAVTRARRELEVFANVAFCKKTQGLLSGLVHYLERLARD